MPLISRTDVDTAKRAAKAMSDLATGWGAASDATTVATFLEAAATNAPLFSAFCDEWGMGNVWHPAQLKDFIESRLGANAETKTWIASGSPLGLRLQSLSAAPDQQLDPARVGTELQSFATGWYDNCVLQFLLQQLPPIFDDPFAFAAMAAKAGRSFKVNEGPEQAKSAIRARVASTIAEGADAATTKLLTKLAAAL